MNSKMTKPLITVVPTYSQSKPASVKLHVMDFGDVKGAVVSTPDKKQGGHTNQDGLLALPSEVRSFDILTLNVGPIHIEVPPPPQGQYLTGVDVWIAAYGLEGKALRDNIRKTVTHPLSDGGAKVTPREQASIDQLLNSP